MKINYLSNFFRLWLAKTTILTVVTFTLLSAQVTSLAAPVLWSNSSSWTSFGATKPVAGSAVTIPEGIHMILDESTPALASLNINGKLEFDRKDLNLTAGWIMIHGTLEIGNPTNLFAQKAIITLNAANLNESNMGMGTRGIMVMGGKLELHGVVPTKIATKINAHAAAGATSLTLADQPGWKVSDQIVVATTDYYGAANGSAERTQISAINGTSVTIQDGLNSQRWGKLQYLTSTGMSLTPGTLPANLSPSTPTVLDERAEVANLTRNIVIQSVDDDLWRTNGFGCHIMIMRMNGMVGEAHLNGVEIRRGGQAGKLGRYPFHWHMLSYSGSTTLPDATGQYIRNSTVNQSAQRGIVIHGTNGTEVSNNIVYDVRGHGIFTEDASERRNKIDGNIVLKVRDPLRANALKQHEIGDRNSSGFWISNPDNIMINNTAADCNGVGFWLAFPRKCFGQSKDVPLIPNRLKFGTFNNNHAHSNGRGGIFLDNVETDELGNTFPDRYDPTSDMKDSPWPFTTIVPYELGDYSVWKNNSHGIWNRSAAVQNRRVVNADNTNSYFAGSIFDGVPSTIEKSLAIGNSLNYNMNGVGNPSRERMAAFASYHSSIEIKDNVVVNFQAVSGMPSGYLALDDYYLTPVDKGNVRNPRNILINTHPGVRTKPRFNQHVFAVLWDKYNYMGVEQSDDNFYVFDDPFFTYGQTRQIVAPGPEVSGGVVIRGPFYGFDQYYVNGIRRTYDKIAVTRTNAAGDAVGSVVVEAGAPGDILGNMRHFAAHPSGFYYLDFPTIDNVNDFIMNVTNMQTTNDYQVLSVEYSGNYTITQLFSSRSHDMDQYGKTKPFPTDHQWAHPYTAVADFQSVVNAPTGEVYWQDKANNKVWFKVRGGLNPGDPNQSPTKDLNLYKPFRIRAYGTQTGNNQTPTVSITAPASNATYTSPANVTITATAADANGSVSKVEFFNGATKLGEDLTSPYSFVWSNVATGTYSLTAKATDNEGAITTSSAVSIVVSNPVTLRNPENPVNTVNGLDYKYYEGTWSVLPNFDMLTPVKTGTVTNFGLSESNINDNFGFKFTGFINVPSDGNYTFYTSSDDGSKLYIGSAEVVNNDGIHGDEEKSGSIGLKAGKHALTLVFFENDKGEALSVSYQGPGITKALIPSLALYRIAPNQAPTVSIVSPINNASFTAPSNILINANAADNDGSVVKVEFFNGSVKLGEDLISPYSFAWNNAAAGTYALTAKATDNLGIVTTSSVVSVIVNTTPISCKLPGTAFGTSPAWNNETSTFDKVFDGDLNSFFDFANASGGYAGLDLGAGTINYITKIRFVPRAGYASRMVGGKFQGSNISTSEGFEDIYTISSEPEEGSFTEVNITSFNAYRYVRYLSPDNGNCNIAEAEFCGEDAVVTGAKTSLYTSNQSLKIYPTPTTYEANLVVESESATEGTVVVTDMLSRERINQKHSFINGSNLVYLNTRDLEAGMYVVTVELEGTRIVSKIQIAR